jgi:hypothetical protein
MAKLKIVTATDKEIYDAVVFQTGRVLSGPNGMGFLEVETATKSYTVVITADDAEQMIAAGLRERPGTPLRTRR